MQNNHLIRYRTFVDWWSKYTGQDRKREPLHDHSDDNTRTKRIPPMLTCVIFKVMQNHHRLASLLSLFTPKHVPRMENRHGRWGTYILHLSVEERAWGQLKRLNHNLGHCLQRRTHSALALIRDRQHTAGRGSFTHTHTHTDYSWLM